MCVCDCVRVEGGTHCSNFVAWAAAASTSRKEHFLLFSVEYMGGGSEGKSDIVIYIPSVRG